MKPGDWDEFWAAKSDDIFDQLNTLDSWSSIAWRVCLEQWLEKLRCFGRGASILECGAGSAVFSRFMSRYGFEATLLDRSESAIAYAEEKFKKEGMSGTFVLGDILSMPLADDSFDVVYSGGVLEFFEDPSIPIQAMAKKLKRGGVFAANIVPRKFSIQSLADIERTLAHSLTKMCWVPTSLIPAQYGVSRVGLARYIEGCRMAGLCSIEGKYVTPFPTLALPRSLQMKYTAWLRNHMVDWRAFNEAEWWWKRWVGIGLMIYGVKR